jgi:hypothetical protein
VGTDADKFDVEIYIKGLTLNVQEPTKVMVFWKRGNRELKSKMHELKPKVNFAKIKNCGVSFHSEIEVVNGERAKKKSVIYVNTQKSKAFKGEIDIADFDFETPKEHKIKLTWNPSSGMAEDKEAYVHVTLKGTRIEPEGSAEQ